MSATRDTPACPACGQKGRRVGRPTLFALLTAEPKARLGETSQMRFCPTPTCEVVYYGDGGLRFSSNALRVPVFQKSSEPSRPVCYCFGHRVADVQAEVARTGASEILSRIVEACRQGLDRCEVENPQGTCCLGNVKNVVTATERRSAEDTPPASCCAVASRRDPT